MFVVCKNAPFDTTDLEAYKSYMSFLESGCVNCPVKQPVQQPGCMSICWECGWKSTCYDNLTLFEEISDQEHTKQLVQNVVQDSFEDLIIEHADQLANELASMQEDMSGILIFQGDTDVLTTDDLAEFVDQHAPSVVPMPTSDAHSPFPLAAMKNKRDQPAD